jgi:hypothetical protein
MKLSGCKNSLRYKKAKYSTSAVKTTPGGLNKRLYICLVPRGRHHKRYSDNATLRFCVTAYGNALYLWRIVIALDFSRALSLMIVIALSLQVGVYRFTSLLC